MVDSTFIIYNSHKRMVQRFCLYTKKKTGKLINSIIKKTFSFLYMENICTVHIHTCIVSHHFKCMISSWGPHNFTYIYYYYKSKVPWNIFTHFIVIELLHSFSFQSWQKSCFTYLLHYLLTKSWTLIQSLARFMPRR